MKQDSWPNLVAMFFDQASRMGDMPMLWAKLDDSWRETSWCDASRDATRLARALAALGVAAGDRVALVAENRPQWPIADIGIMAAGAITVPAYTTNKASDHLHVLSNSGARGAIVSTVRLAEQLMPAAEQAGLDFVIAMEAPVADSATVPIHLWDDLLAAQDGDGEAETVGAIARTDTACLIYTSGTGGAPKGVMLSHGAILANCYSAYKLLEHIGLDDDVFLSFLPLSHSYEHTVGQFFPISIGAQIYYAEGPEKLGANMVEVKPTIMTAVPRLYESLHQRILRGVNHAGGLQRALFMKAVRLGRRNYEDPDALGVCSRLLNKLLDALVRSKVKARFGGRLKVMVSGGAPLNYDIGVFFLGLGLPLLQGYGQTESAPVISCNPPEKNRIDTVGPALAGVEVKLAGDGEILARGELVMQGYWNNSQATAETVKDGWLFTGDIGEIDGDGYICITDRKKDIIVNSGGDNISPQRIEGMLTLQPEISQAMVHGDRKPHLVAMIVADADFARDWAEAAGKADDPAVLAEDKDFYAAVGEAVDRVNETLAVIERVRRFTVTPEPFTVDNGMMTPTMKIRRHLIVKQFGDALDRLYGG